MPKLFSSTISLLSDRFDLHFDSIWMDTMKWNKEADFFVTEFLKLLATQKYWINSSTNASVSTPNLQTTLIK